jgi:hypothetical protein
VGSLGPADPIFADIRLDNVGPIPLGSSVTGFGGFFDLLTQAGTPGFGLALEIGSFEVFATASGLNVFGAGVTTDIFDQELPFNLHIGAPVNFSFTTRILTSTRDCCSLTSFTGTGSGSVSGAAVPEPGTLLLLGSGFLGVAAFVRRRR